MTRLKVSDRRDVSRIFEIKPLISKKLFFEISEFNT